MGQAIITCDPASDDLARDELSKAPPASQITAELAPGVLLVELAESHWALAEWWRAQPPIFVRHLCPVQATLQLQGSEQDLASLREAVETGFAELIDPELAFSVQARILSQDYRYKPFDLNTALAEFIQASTHAPLDVRAPQQILSVVVGQRPPVAFLGLSPAIYNLSDWAGGVRRFAREPGQISRSEFKLLEALEVFKIELPPHGLALDLGAAPGGWTRVLRQRGQYVTAIDPAILDDRLSGDKGIRYRRVTAEAYLADGPDQFDLIANDMRMDARDSARLMAAYARYLYPHGCALMTLKLPELNRRTLLQHALDILGKSYVLAGARQLFHNRSEITVYLKQR